MVEFSSVTQPEDTIGGLKVPLRLQCPHTAEKRPLAQLATSSGVGAELGKLAQELAKKG